MSKLLSVIIPVFKAGDYIKISSESVLNSTYSNIELILVDDGSPDNSGSICDYIASKDPRVRVIHKKNGGVSSARNVGISAALGQYIAFVDADDTVRKDMYERLMEKADEGFDIAYSDFILSYPENEVVYKTFDVYQDHDDTYKDLLLKGYGCNVWNMVIRRSVITDNTLCFPEYLRFSEDVWFSLRLHLCTDKIAKVAEPLYIYNLANSKQATANLDDCFIMNKMRCLDETLHFIIEKGKEQAFKKEISWLMLQLKTNWVLDPSKCQMYQDWHPEANLYVKHCPLLSSKMKLAMWLMNHRIYYPVRMMAKLYTKRQ